MPLPMFLGSTKKACRFVGTHPNREIIEQRLGVMNTKRRTYPVKNLDKIFINERSDYIMKPIIWLQFNCNVFSG